MPEEIVQDERRHEASLNAELELFYQDGLQSYLDAASGPGRGISDFTPAYW